MEKNEHLSNEQQILDLVKSLGSTVKGLEQRVVKNEQLILHTFSYLYTRQDSFNYEHNMKYIDESLNYLTDQYKLLSENLIPKKKLKRKRPWHYFISKHFKYKRLCKEREILHENQRIAKEERLRKEAEERRIKAEQERLEKIKREEEAKKQAEKRKQDARKKMTQILTNISK